eukprot:7292008-Pyramimonas_sp.AAC.3
MNRFTEWNVLAGLRCSCPSASRPTSIAPSAVTATTDGSVRSPSRLSTISGAPVGPITATAELVVPRSTPTVSPAFPELELEVDSPAEVLSTGVLARALQDCWRAAERMLLARLCSWGRGNWGEKPCEKFRL